MGEVIALSLEGVAAAGERRVEDEGDGKDIIFGIVWASGEGGRARAGETDGTRLIEDWPEGRLL